MKTILILAATSIATLLLAADSFGCEDTHKNSHQQKVTLENQGDCQKAPSPEVIPGMI